MTRRRERVAVDRSVLPADQRPVIRYSSRVAEALDQGRAVVALESSVFAQGLPQPANAEAAHRMSSALARRGAEPAVAAVVRGQLTFGLGDDDMARFLAREGVRKVSARDLPAAMLHGADGATTVAGTLAMLALTPIRVFATGGIGGVHREPAFDESADLAELARTPAVVICAGAKSILDLPATLERLESLGVPVVGYRTSELPGFFTAETGLSLDTRVETPEEVARLFLMHRSLGRRQAIVVMQPPPAASALPRALIDAAVASTEREARQEGIRGAALTPYLLAGIGRETSGRSLAANLALLEENAALAAEVALALRREVNASVADALRSV